jgi:DNA-binding winged helix-turn-helix (wHTH) protein/TolB-like protein/Tfp pilus assembly protein PilF
MRNAPKHFYEFGPFRLDADKHRLMRDGELVHLSPKAIDALLVLVQHPGKLMDREALMQAVWADSFVEDANLTVAISNLRRALGQNAETAEYIETVPRVGYRFVADVRETYEEPAPLIIEKRTLSRTVIEEESQPEPSPVSVDLPVTRSLPGNRLRTQLLTVAALSLFALIGSGLIRNFRDTKGSANSTAQIRSIAVLPLKSFGQKDEDEELRLRITDALITRLGGLSEISLRPTDSILRFANEKADAIEAGKELEVDAILDGRIQTEGDRLRVTLQLVNVQTGQQIWSGQFDGNTKQILSLQDKISAQLLPRLAQSPHVARAATTNSEAYENYLKGRYLWNRRVQADIKRAITYFQHAVALDPGFALAYAGLADAYSMLASGGSLEAAEGYAKATEMANKALAIDPNLSEAYAALGWVLHRYEWKWEEAEQAFARAVELNPNNAEAHHWRALNFRSVGKSEEFVASLERARALAPLTKPIAQNYYEIVLLKNGCEAALEYLEKFHALYPGSAAQHAELTGHHHAKCGNYSQTIEVLERISGDELPVKAQAFLGVAYAKTGKRQEALQMLGRLKRHDSTMKFYLMPYIYVALGDLDSALADLQRGIDKRDNRFTRLRFDEYLTPLHSDPRFKLLLKKMNLPE